MTTPEPPSEGPKTPARHATLGQVVGAVFWSFFGVRKSSAMSRDAVTIRPWQVIVVGILFAALFVLALVTLVHFIVANAK